MRPMKTGEYDQRSVLHRAVQNPFYWRMKRSTHLKVAQLKDEVLILAFFWDFFQRGTAKKFLGGAPSKFYGANDSRGEGQNFFKKMKFSHRVEISIISVFQYYSTIKTYRKVHGIH